MSPTNPTSSSRRAYQCPKVLVVFILIVAAGLAADLASKQLIFESMLADPALNEKLAQPYLRPITGREALGQFQRPILPGVKFTLSTNPGVVFGLEMNRLLVGIATVGTIVMLVALMATSDASAYVLHAAMAMIMAGALGNLYDRLFAIVEPPGFEPIRGQVRDFIDCSDLYYPWIFNVADILLVIGVGILAVCWVRPHKAGPSGGQDKAK